MDDAFASRICTRSVRPCGVCGTNTRAYLVQVSDQHGTRLVENLRSVACVCNSPFILSYRVPGHPSSNTRRVLGITRTRTGSDSSGYYPSSTRVVDERVPTRVCPHVQDLHLTPRPCVLPDRVQRAKRKKGETYDTCKVYVTGGRAVGWAHPHY